ncbi:hypothetical protein [Pseudofrankia sp. DC12]|uniref:baeRF2 domain-containing protein n=1 Tax=Pseudofrankia sp. DC12 TaxID=683315 RepID=UPI0005F77465|nr:hypothetical protein [Pseudofrankia sp. DC12]
MKLSFLDPVYARPGPYACAYLDTSTDVDDPRKAVELRWRHLRDDLRSQGADPAAITAAAAAVGCDLEVSGRHGQAIVAAQDRLALVEELAEPPARDSARYGPLPDMMRLAIAHAPDIPYVAVLVIRSQRGATRQAETCIDVEVETGRWPTSAASPGLRCRWQLQAAQWRSRAAEVVAQLEDLAGAHGSEMIVLAGDMWARRDLLHQLPRVLRAATVEADAEFAGTAGGRALLEDTLRDVFHGRLGHRDRTMVNVFLAQRARHPQAVEGMAATVAALRRGQAQALLVNPPAAFTRPLWVGPEPTHLALTAQDLRSIGVGHPREEPADAALIRATVGTGAELVAAPPDVVTLAGGVGVLPRYVDASAAA